MIYLGFRVAGGLECWAVGHGNKAPRPNEPEQYKASHPTEQSES